MKVFGVEKQMIQTLSDWRVKITFPPWKSWVVVWIKYKCFRMPRMQGAVGRPKPDNNSQMLVSSLVSPSRAELSPWSWVWQWFCDWAVFRPRGPGSLWQTVGDRLTSHWIKLAWFCIVTIKVRRRRKQKATKNTIFFFFLLTDLV